jgi:hypothetical protein
MEVDAFPTETGWTLRESAGTLIAGRSTGSFCTDGGAVPKPAHITDGVYTFEMNDTRGDWICCQYSVGEFKITVNGEPVAITGVSIRRSEKLRTGPTVGTSQYGCQFPSAG